MMHRSKNLQATGDGESYFNEKRQVNLRGDASGLVMIGDLKPEPV
jgi:hypothetical protein